MIPPELAQAHWAQFIVPAYAATLVSLVALAAVAFVRLQHWARAAREDP
jgi:heme exporter protein D